MNELINSILWFSYYPNCTESKLSEPVFDAVSKDKNENDRISFQEGKEAFNNAISAQLHEKDIEKTHLIPLSSGLDSRAVLAGLLEQPNLNQSNIHTVSFGSPGTWDYENGQKVAKAAGVSNTAIDLTDKSIDWSVESLQRYADDRDIPTRVIDGYINSMAYSVVNDDFVVWSGFMGDPTAGGHQPDNPRNDWDDACSYFIEREKYCNNLAHPEFKPSSVLPDGPFVSHKELSYEEQLDFALRQQCLIAPIVLHSDCYRTPFTQSSWLEFSLNLPHKDRIKRTFFKDMFKYFYPDLFSLPTDANSGLPLYAHPMRKWIRNKRLGLTKRAHSLVNMEYCHPGTNYIDFSSVFRIDHQLRDTMYTLLSRFANRDYANWIDPMEIWNEHQNGVNRTNEIRTIASLELFCD